MSPQFHQLRSTLRNQRANCVVEELLRVSTFSSPNADVRVSVDAKCPANLAHKTKVGGGSRASYGGEDEAKIYNQSLIRLMLPTSSPLPK
jgi:hypothetical protein